MCLLGGLEVEHLKCVSARQETRGKSHVTSKGEASKEEDDIVCSQKKKKSSAERTQYHYKM